jgi:hypothetical protein
MRTAAEADINRLSGRASADAQRLVETGVTGKVVLDAR